MEYKEYICIYIHPNLSALSFFSFPKILSIRKFQIPSKLFDWITNVIQDRICFKISSIDSRKDNRHGRRGRGAHQFLLRCLCSLKWKQVSESSSLAAFASTVCMYVCMHVYIYIYVCVCVCYVVTYRIFSTMREENLRCNSKINTKVCIV